jgi:hypothetical protein
MRHRISCPGNRKRTDNKNIRTLNKASEMSWGKLTALRILIPGFFGSVRLQRQWTARDSWKCHSRTDQTLGWRLCPLNDDHQQSTYGFASELEGENDKIGLD